MSSLGITTRSALYTPFNYRERLAEIQTKVRDFEKKMGIPKSVDLSVIEFDRSACAQLDQNMIKLPSWFLFKYDDIPPHFRIADIHDPRLVDRNFLNEFATWMNGKITEAGLTTICRPADRGVLQLVIKLMRNRDLYEKCKDFTLGHELSHLAQSQQGQHAYLIKMAHEAVALGGVMGGIFLLFLAVSIIPVVHLAVTLLVSGVAIVVTIGGVVAWLNKPEGSPSLSDIEEEKKADLDAARILGNAEGGIHTFGTHMIHNLAIRSQVHSQEGNIDVVGNNLRDKKHPRLSDRVEYLRRWQMEHAIRA